MASSGGSREVAIYNKVRFFMLKTRGTECVHAAHSVIC